MSLLGLDQYPIFKPVTLPNVHTGMRTPQPNTRKSSETATGRPPFPVRRAVRQSPSPQAALRQSWKRNEARPIHARCDRFRSATLIGLIAADISFGVIHDRAQRPRAARRSEVVNNSAVGENNAGGRLATAPSPSYRSDPQRIKGRPPCSARIFILKSASPSFLGNLLSPSRKASRNLCAHPPHFPVQRRPTKSATLAPVLGAQWASAVGVASLIASTGGLTRNHAT